MNAYLVTIPITLTPEQLDAVDGRGWKLAADLRGDVMAAAVPSTVIEVGAGSPGHAANAVAEAFGLDPDEVRVEER